MARLDYNALWDGALIYIKILQKPFWGFIRPKHDRLGHVESGGKRFLGRFFKKRSFFLSSREPVMLGRARQAPGR
jgi:hypothetical protein